MVVSMGTLLIKAGSLAKAILRKSSCYKSEVMKGHRGQTTEATRRIVSQEIARGARRLESRSPACPHPQGARSEFMLVYSVLVKANIMNRPYTQRPETSVGCKTIRSEAWVKPIVRCASIVH